MALGEADDLAEELLVDVAEDFGGQDGELVRAVGIIERADDVFEYGVVDVEAGGERVGFAAAFLMREVEEAGVIFFVGTGVEFRQAVVNIFSVEQAAQLPVWFDAAVFAHAQEDDAVDGALYGEVEFVHGEAAVAQGDVACQAQPPALYLREEFPVNLRCAALALRGFDVLVEGALLDGLLREGVGDFVPAFGVVAPGQVEYARDGGLVVFARGYAAVIDGELLEVGQDGERQFGRPCVASQLVGGVGAALDVNAGALGFEEEFRHAADAEAVVGGLRAAGDLYGGLVDHVLVRLGLAGLVGHVPAERLEEGVDEFLADLRLLVAGGAVGVDVALEALHQFQDLLWDFCHGDAFSL